MLDLSSFATPFSPAGKSRRGVRWWLVREDVEPEEVLTHLVAAIQAGGWRRIAQEKLVFLLESRRGKLVVRIEDDPCREVARRSAGGQEERGALWSEEYAGRVIVSVEIT